MSKDARAQDLVDLGNKLFSKKEPLNSLMQEIALQFFPVRATFTGGGDYLGRDVADHLQDSYPSIVRRELGNAISAMLRPRDQKWFSTTTMDEDRDADPTNAKYLEYVTRQMRTAIYDHRAKFIRATKEGDHDFVTFGQTVISIEESSDRTHLYYRCHHLRDCAWLDNDTGDTDHLHGKDRMSARMMARAFGEKNLHASVKDACRKDPSQEFNVRRIMMPTDEYDYIGPDARPGPGKRKHPYCLLYVDADNLTVLKEAPAPDFIFAVPRWQTLPGLQYAVSPATSIALPDGRLAQAVSLMIQEAGEKAVDPPILASGEAIREVNLQAGAITWADIATDGSLKDAAMPFHINADMRTAFAMRADLREMLNKAFFVDKLRLPDTGGDKTATEVRALIEEHIRNLLPIFEPMEHEYNMRLLDKTFDRLHAMNKFSAADMPDDLSGAKISWGFKNPLQEASERILKSQFLEAAEIETAAAQLGVSSARVNWRIARDDAARGIGIPAKWRKQDDEMAAEEDAKAKAEMLEKAVMQAGAVAQVGQQAGDAAQSMQTAGMIGGPGGEPAENDDEGLPELFPDDDYEDAEAVA